MENEEAKKANKEYWEQRDREIQEKIADEICPRCGSRDVEEVILDYDFWIGVTCRACNEYWRIPDF